MNFTGAVALLQGLVQTEGCSSESANRNCELSKISAIISSADALSADGESFWKACADANISINALSRSLAGALGSTDHAQAWNAAAVLTSLLAIPGAPVASLLSSPALSAVLELVQKCCAAARTSKHGEDDAQNQQASEQDEQQCAFVLRKLAVLLSSHSLAKQPDMLLPLMDTLGEAARSSCAKEDVAEAAFQALAHILQPMHGSVEDHSAYILRQLMAGLLGLSESSTDSKDTNYQRSAAAIRGGIIAFATQCCSISEGCREAVAALARYVLLKCPDKAEFRGRAVECAIKLTCGLPQRERNDFVVFTVRLSRTAKVAQRMLAVELAAAVLQAYPDPFDPGNAVMAPSRSSRGPRESSSGTTSVFGMSPAASTPAHSEAASADTYSGLDTAATAVQVPGSSCHPAPWGTICLGLLLQRCSDKSAAVRAKALHHLAEAVHGMLAGMGAMEAQRAEQCRWALVLASSVQMAHSALGNTPAIITPPLVSPATPDEPGATPMQDTPNLVDGVSASGAPFVQKKRGNLRHALLDNAYREAAARVAQIDLDMGALVGLARRRCVDGKAGVRKAAVKLLEALLLLRASGAGGADVVLLSGPDIEAIQHAAADPMVSVRKAALGVIAALLKALPGEASLAQLWVTSALPMVRDVEASLQEQLLDHVHTFLMLPAGAVHPGKRSAAGTAEEALARVLPLLAALSGSAGAAAPCLARACLQLKAKSRLAAGKIAAGLQAVIAGHGADAEKTAEISGAWLVLAQVAALDPSAPSWEFLQEHWQKARAAEGWNAGSGDGGASVLRVIGHASARFPDSEAASLCKDLLKAVRAFTLPPAAAAAHVSAIHQLSAARGDGAWAPVLQKDCEEHLGRYVDAASKGTLTGDAAKAEWQACTAAFTAGEVALLRGMKATGRLLVLVQALTSPKLAAVDDAAGAVPAPLQAHAWVALGKFCLVDEGTAKKSVPLFVQELGRATNPAVRNNIMVALTDMTVQYTVLVDAHVPRLAACLADPNELVRRQALALLATLLSRDYVKWRGQLFHQFMRALVDDSHEVRSLANYLLADALSSKAPLLAYNHFVEAVFVLNECRPGLLAAAAEEDPISLTQLTAGPAAAGACRLTGPDEATRAKRDTIYRTLLRRMAPEHKFATSARLCSEVLSGFADGVLPLDSAAEVLRDALHILASKDVKVMGSKGASEEDEAVTAGSVASAAKGKLVSSMMKKYLAEAMVPMLLELRRALEAARHPLLGQLLATLASLLKEHKNEMHDILGGDKQLVQELLHDMKQKAAAQRHSGHSGHAAAPPAATLASTQAGAPASPAAAQQAPQGGSRRPSRLHLETHRSASPHGVDAGTPIAARVLAESAAAESAQRAGGFGASPGAATPAHTASPAIVGTPRAGLIRAAQVAKTPVTQQALSPYDFKTPATSRRTPQGSVRAEAHTPSMSVPRIKASASKASRLIQASVKKEAKVELEEGDEENWDANRPADVYLPSPDRADKPPKQWNIPADACQGSADRARKGSRLAVSSLAEVTKEGLSSLGLADAPKPAGDVEAGSRPGRKRKGVV